MILTGEAGVGGQVRTEQEDFKECTFRPRLVAGIPQAEA